MTFGHCGERRKGTESCKTFTQEMVKWKMERREEERDNKVMEIMGKGKRRN